MRFGLMTFLVCLLSSPAFTQATSVGTATVSPVPAPERTSSIAAGEEVVDQDGRRVTNGGTNANGSVKIRHTGSITWGNQVPRHGTIRDGSISAVTNPATGGSDGPITVNTNGRDTTITLDGTGGRNGSVTTRVNGGSASIIIAGSNQNVTIDGLDNTVTIPGSNNNATGTQTSSGSVRITGRGNTFRSGGGNWEFRS